MQMGMGYFGFRAFGLLLIIYYVHTYVSTYIHTHIRIHKYIHTKMHTVVSTNYSPKSPELRKS